MTYAIILAGGVGQRAGGSLPKQFQIIGGKPMLFWSIKAFLDAISDISIHIVCNRDYTDHCVSVLNLLVEEGYSDHIIIACGGKSRIESVKNGLTSVYNGCHPVSKDSVVLIHDGARPLVSDTVIRDALAKVRHGVGVVPGIPLSDSIRKVEAAKTMAVNRNELVAVQTPQVFMFDEIFKAYDNVNNEAYFTDDASVAEAAGLKIDLSKGEPENIKVTNPVDFVIAGVLLEKK